MAKPAAPHRKPRTTLDLFAGWGFWLFVFAVLYVPSWFWLSRNAYNDTKTGIFPWTGALVLAALGAGIVTWAVNTALRWWSRRAQRAARRKR